MDAATSVLIWCSVGMMLLLSYALHVDRKKIRALTKPTPKITKVTEALVSESGAINVSGDGDPPADLHERFHVSFNGEIIPCRVVDVTTTMGRWPATTWRGVDEAALLRMYWFGGDRPWADDDDLLPWDDRLDRRALLGIAVAVAIAVAYLTWQLVR